MATLCLFCGGEDGPDHALTCGMAKFGGWTPPINAASPALDGLAQETLDAILGSVTAEQIMTFVNVLTNQPQKAEKLRQLLLHHGSGWFPVNCKRDTQLRRIRTIRDAAVVSGYPVATTNKGYWLGGWADVLDAAERAEKFAHGALKRAQLLKKLATKMTGGS